MKSKVRCSKCGLMFAIKLDGEIRRHRPCYDGPVVQPSRQNFSVFIAPPPPDQNVESLFDAVDFDKAAKAADEKAALEAEYAINLKKNEEESRALSQIHEQQLAEEKARAAAAESARIAKAIEERKLYWPYEYCKQNADSTIPHYFLDLNNGFYTYKWNENPYQLKAQKEEAKAKMKSVKPIQKKKKRREQLVYWNSRVGDTSLLCEGEWEYQTV